MLFDYAYPLKVGKNDIILTMMQSLRNAVTAPSLLSGFVLFNPQGPVAEAQMHIFFTALILMLVIAVPVFVIAAVFAYEYRKSNTRARYMPTWDHNTFGEFVWWTVPTVVIAILAVVSWHSTRDLDPYKPIHAEAAPVRIQVVALDWKWLFIYPDEGIATVNYLRVPTKTPLAFEITADAPMNSFWIPQLGGQIYAMAGMMTKLHLLAETVGKYQGLSGNFSGAGFSEMKFVADAVPPESYRSWTAEVKNASSTLDMSTYARLRVPTIAHASTTYSAVDPDLFTTIMHSFMTARQKPEYHQNHAGTH
ncbi:ubiquinol oxidase subunit II [bacterium]|nr:ubiquinol oxidase subunit II [bacterium]